MNSRTVLESIRSRATATAYQVASHLGYNFILSQYVTSQPSPQNALDIFRGEWSSRLPEPYAHLTAGQIELFNDARITWMAQELGGLTGKTVLELGPLEGGHSYMLEQLGASSVLAVEANTRAYLKCLIVKELLKLQRVEFLCGDFVEYLRQPGPAFDVCVGSGVLYHMQNPVELIELLAARCRQHLFLWTHYYDPTVIEGSAKLSAKFSERLEREHHGFRHTLHRYNYQSALMSGAFCGGSAPFSHWLSRTELLDCLRFFGFGNVRISFDHPGHDNGPSLALVAERTT